MNVCSTFGIALGNIDLSLDATGKLEEAPAFASIQRIPDPHWAPPIQKHTRLSRDTSPSQVTHSLNALQK